jgi:uncharacterized protein (DUF433 family)
MTVSRKKFLALDDAVIVKGIIKTSRINSLNVVRNIYIATALREGMHPNELAAQYNISRDRVMQIAWKLARHGIRL